MMAIRNNNINLTNLPTPAIITTWRKKSIYSRRCKTVPEGLNRRWIGSWMRSINR